MVLIITGTPTSTYLQLCVIGVNTDRQPEIYKRIYDKLDLRDLLEVNVHRHMRTIGVKKRFLYDIIP